MLDIEPLDLSTEDVVWEGERECVCGMWREGEGGWDRQSIAKKRGWDREMKGVGSASPRR